jgi:hypothetical protein
MCSHALSDKMISADPVSAAADVLHGYRRSGERNDGSRRRKRQDGTLGLWVQFTMTVTTVIAVVLPPEPVTVTM